MGHKLTPSEEVQLIRDVTRTAHEVLQDLLTAIREARLLAPTLTARFTEHADNEIKSLSNFITSESNRHAAELNANVQQAREEVMRQLAVAEITLDESNDQARLVFKSGRFDDNVPPPYPKHLTTGDTQ